jgi:hypothetical protein
MEYVITIIGGVVNAVVTLAGVFLYHRQTAAAKEIDNEAKRSEEWRKLYEESKADSERKETVITDLRHQLHQEEVARFKAEKDRVRLDSARCDNFWCTQRKPPLKDIIVEQITAVESHE